MNKQALIVFGGWDGHHPHALADLFAEWLRSEGFDVTLSDMLASFEDSALLTRTDLIIPIWTMGRISEVQLKNVIAAVEAGTGLAGCHGGMCDAFREATDWHWMTGGQWVAHPGNFVKHRYRVIRGSHPIVEGIDDFEINSEQYLMHTDPSNRVLAVTEFPTADGPHVPNGRFDMPAIWTRHFGKGRVFYNSIGHDPDVVKTQPVPTIMRRGFAWAAR